MPDNLFRDGSPETRIRELEEKIALLEGDIRNDPYRELFERSADAILIIEGDTFVDCNQATVEMLRYKNRSELLQTHPSELSPEFQPDGRRSYEKANEMIAIAFERGSHRFEWDHKRADGEVFPVEVLLTAVPRGDTRLLHVVWRDITERKKLEEELFQAQKMKAIGQLTGGIAHDFNNLLLPILGYADMLENFLDDRGDLQEYVVEIKKAAKRAASLVAQLMAFSRKQVMKPKVFDLNGLLENLNRMLERLLGEEIRIAMRLEEGPIYVKADPVQLEQVVINLVTNARDAMPQGGLLKLETARVTVTEAGGAHDFELAPGQYVVLTVTDTGIGIDQTILDNVFDPFFTTKEMGKGTGMGLSMVYGIIKQSGGEIKVFSDPGKETVFKIVLPFAEEVRGLVKELVREDKAPDPRANETILVVEDEPAVAGLLQKVLENEGYTVHCANNGEEALAVSQAPGLRIDLLLTDVIMPRINGPELARRLLQIHPDIKVLYSSGYTDTYLNIRGGLERGVDLIQKPYAPAELTQRIRRCLDERSL